MGLKLAVPSEFIDMASLRLIFSNFMHDFE